MQAAHLAFDCLPNPAHHYTLSTMLPPAIVRLTFTLWAVFTVWHMTSSICVAQSVSFNRDIRPLLAKHCWACHGPDQQARQADLRLDNREAAIAPRDTQPAIVAHDPKSSELIRRIASSDPEIIMPPPDAGERLSQSQIELLSRWIEDGANFETHWSFVPPVKPPLPDVVRTNWEQQPLDRFLLSKMEQEKLTPAPPADRATWLRRVYLDLVGLPPTTDEVQAYLAETDPQADAIVVDRLLAKPEFGERWGRAWLDLARYADTNGYEKDRPRSIWLYRDWVIEAINDDMPFDTFTVQQLAGDMLAPQDPKSKIATGLHRNTMLNEEGGIDPLEFRFYAMNDRMATTGLIWLGLTVGCAQCHSHKFDPISHREYYEFMALFNNADEPDYAYVSKELQQQHAAIESQIAALEASLPVQFPIDEATSSGPAAGGKQSSAEAFEDKYQQWIEQQRQLAVEWRVVVPSQMKTNMPRLEVLADGSIFSTGDITKRDVFELTLPASAIGDQPITAWRLEALPDDRLPAGGPGRCYYEGRRGDFFLSEVKFSTQRQKLNIREASHSYGKNGLGSGSAEAKNVFDGDGSTGWSTADREGEPHQLVLVLDGPQVITDDLKLEMIFERHYATSLGRFRWSVTSASKNAVAQDMPAHLQATLSKPKVQWTEIESAQLRRHFALTCKELAPARRKLDQLRAKLPKAPTTLVMEERPSDNRRPTYRHHRGEYLSPREEVQAALPELFRRTTKRPPQNRLEAARWLASQENPLVARVFVNRVWQAFFGDGLVRSQGDFGTQSPPPTHPQLLDWLAVDWMESGWSLKRLCRSIALSATYRQDSKLTPELLERDPENLWLARFSRQRVDAEVLRDTWLTASGLLCREVGGESVRPPQPASVTALAYGGGAWPESKGSDRYRRSLYTYAKRTAPFAAYMAFDAPSGETCAVRRDRSNTPLQALTLLNDKMFLEMAETLGYQVCSLTDDDSQRAQNLAYRVWSRRPHAAETKAILEYVHQQKQRIDKGELKPELQSDDTALKQQIQQQPHVLAWVMAARALLNTDEAIVKP